MSIQPHGSVSVHLIDPADGRTLQTWSFAQQRITIGRGETESIPLADPYVSRLHAELICVGGVWQLFARGRNGVFVNGKSVAESRLDHGGTFRLGISGPMFRFDAAPAATGQATLSFDPDAIIVLAFDRSEVQEQAQDIVETDYFRQLQEKARLLRRQRAATAPRSD